MNYLENIFTERVLHALGWTVLHSFWQAFLVALVLSAFLFFLRKNAARVRHLLAYAALLLVLVSSLFTFWLLLDKSGESTRALLLWPEPGNPTQGAGIWLSEFTAWCDAHLPVIVMVWMLGVVLFSLRFAGGLIAVQRLKYRNTSPPEACWQERLNGLLEEMSLNRKVVLLESLATGVPMVVGWLKPVVLFPVGAINRLSVEEVEAVLAHELAHIKRQDYLLNLLQSIVEILFYFNPAVWWISSQVRLEREHSADDLAVAVCGDSLVYARALFKLQEIRQTAPLLAMPLMKKNYRLLNRIHRILKPSSNKTDLMERISAMAILVVATLLLSFNTKNTAVAEEAQPLTEPDLPEATFTDWQEMSSDTIPDIEKREEVRRFHRSNGKEEIEVEMRNGEITKLKIDGRVIPESEYPKHEKRIQELMEELPTPPAPPVPPAAPVPPTAPPPASGFSPEQEAVIHSFGKQQRKIVTKKTGRGETTIIVETGPGEEPVEIIVKEGKKGSVIINGQEIKGMKKGDQTIILEDAGGSVFWDAYVFTDPQDFDNYRFFAHPDGFEFNFDFDELKERTLQLEELMRERFGHLDEEWFQQHADGNFDEAELKARMEELRQRMKEQEAVMQERMKEFQHEAEARLREQAGRLEEMELRKQVELEKLQKELEKEQLKLEKELLKLQKKEKNKRSKL